MTDAEALELDPADLRLLGHFYQNDLRLELTEGPESVDIAPPMSTWRSMAIMTTVIGLIYAGFIWITIASGVVEQSGPMIWVVLLLIGILGVAGPVVAHQLDRLVRPLAGQPIGVGPGRRYVSGSNCGSSLRFLARHRQTLIPESIDCHGRGVRSSKIAALL